MVRSPFIPEGLKAISRSIRQPAADPGPFYPFGRLNRSFLGSREFSKRVTIVFYVFLVGEREGH